MRKLLLRLTLLLGTAALLGGLVEAGPIVDGRLAGGWRVTITVPTSSWEHRAS